MKIKVMMMIILCTLLVLSGCGDQMYLEKSDIILLLGIDLDEKNEVIFYATSPSFNPESKKSYHVMKTKAKSLREARYQFDSLSQGTIAPGKIQTILIGKRLLQKSTVIPYLDLFLRDPKDDLNSRMVMVDGPVKDVFHSNMEDKGRLGVVIRNMIDSTFHSGVIANPNLQQYTVQQFDKRFSPMIPSIKVINNEPKITGMALLSHGGLYTASWNLTQSSIALSLQKFFTERIPIALLISSNKIQTHKNLNRIGLEIKHIKRKINTTKVNGHFQFDVHLTLYAELVEKMFYINSKERYELVKKLIESQLNKEYQKIIKMSQDKKIDPIGFGVYARSQQYKEWKKIKGSWFEEFSNAKVNIHTNMILINTGVSY